VLRVWVSFVGLSWAAVCNTVWAVVRRGLFVPDGFVFLCTGGSRVVVERVVGKLRLVLGDFGVRVVEVEDRGDLGYFVGVVDGVVGGLVRDGCEVAVDVGPGRKPMSIAMLLVALRYGVRAFYLYLEDESYRDVDYPLVPFPLQRLEEVSFGLVEGR